MNGKVEQGRVPYSASYFWGPLKLDATHRDTLRANGEHLKELEYLLIHVYFQELLIPWSFRPTCGYKKNVFCCQNKPSGNNIQVHGSLMARW